MRWRGRRAKRRGWQTCHWRVVVKNESLELGFSEGWVKFEMCVPIDESSDVQVQVQRCHHGFIMCLTRQDTTARAMQCNGALACTLFYRWNNQFHHLSFTKFIWIFCLLKLVQSITMEQYSKIASNETGLYTLFIVTFSNTNTFK